MTLEMHPDIKSFYENEFGPIYVLEGSNSFWKNVPAYYYKDDNSTLHIIACPFTPSKLAYHLIDRWYVEDLMLKVLKLKAFI